VYRKRVRRNEIRGGLAIHTGLTNGVEFRGRIDAWIKLIPGCYLHAAVGAEYRNLRPRIAIPDKRSQGKGARGAGHGNRPRLHRRRAQNLHLAARKKRSVEAGVAEIAEKNIRSWGLQRESGQGRQSFPSKSVDGEKRLLRSGCTHQQSRVYFAESLRRQSRHP